MQIDTLGVDYICVHTASDVQEQGGNPLGELDRVRSVVQNAKLAVAGGINGEMLPRIIPYQPEIVIVGSAITRAQDKRHAALELKKVMK